MSVLITLLTFKCRTVDLQEWKNRSALQAVSRPSPRADPASFIVVAYPRPDLSMQRNALALVIAPEAH